MEKWGSIIHQLRAVVEFRDYQACSNGQDFKVLGIGTSKPYPNWTWTHVTSEKVLFFLPNKVIVFGRNVILSCQLCEVLVL